MDSMALLKNRIKQLISPTHFWTLGQDKNELKKIAGFLGIQVSDNDLQNVVVSSSFDNMRSLEEKYSKDWLPTRSSRIDKSFVRSGKSGSWGADLSPEYAEIILKQWHTLMTKFNYE